MSQEPNDKAKYKDPDCEENSSKYHTGKLCFEPGCENPAGTAWGPHWTNDKPRRMM